MDIKTKALVDAALQSYFDANDAKNKGASAEKKTAKTVEVLLKDEKELHEYAVNNKVTLVAGVTTENVYEIDPRKVFELYPDKFWEIVSIAKGTAETVLGERGATKCTVERKETKFRIKKVKE